MILLYVGDSNESKNQKRICDLEMQNQRKILKQEDSIEFFEKDWKTY